MTIPPGAGRAWTLVTCLTGSPSPQPTPRLRQIAATVDPGAGVALGLTMAATLDGLGEGTLTVGNTLVLMPTVVAVVTVVGLVAAIAPARRGLAVLPVETLRDE